MAKKDGRKLDHQELEVIRLRAVARVQAGASPEDVIREIGFSRSRIYAWLAVHKAVGYEGLRAKRIPGRPRRLGNSQVACLLQTLAKKDPRDFKFDDALWSVAIIRELITRQYGVNLGRLATQRWLREVALLEQPGKLFHGRAERGSAGRWLKNLRRDAACRTARLIFIHERRIRRLGWSVLTASTPRRQMRFMITKAPAAPEAFVELFGRLLANSRRAWVLVASRKLAEDKPLRSDPVTAFLRNSGNRLRLEFIPRAEN